MAPAPPPPPGPPPPPMMPPTVPTGGGSSNQRSMLLQSIRDGTKLKKTVTVDKSAPFIPGKTTGVNHLSSDSSRDTATIRNQFTVNGGGPPGFGSLFAHGMPKLKPTGLSIAPTTNSRDLHPPKGPSSDSKARGPPPQPPPASQKPSLFSSASDSTLTSVSSSVNGTPTRPAPPVIVNKAPVGGYGKPNVAPKPPVSKEPPSPNQSSLHSQSNSIGGSLQTLYDPKRNGSSQNLSLMGQSDQIRKPSPPPKVSVNGRPGVNRAQSMRAPKSPPVAPTTTPPFPPNVRHNLVKAPGSLHQSQDGLNGRNFASKTGTLPHNFIQKMAQLPPNIPPPPTPTQSQRGTPTRPPVSRPPPPPSRPAAPPAPPPPPPHRSSPAPPPPPPTSSQGRLLPSAASNSVPPAPPTRNSSMRNGVPSYLTEIESKFSHLFHSIHEFPEPGVYRNVVKSYNTKSSANAKQPAPQPPVHPQPTTHVQLNNKMWVNNTSQC